jgi:hypothetical protein
VQTAAPAAEPTPYGHRVRAPLTQDDVDELVMSARSAEEHHTAAAQQEANQPRPADADVTAAFLLVSAREQLTTSCMLTNDLVHG